MTESKALHDKVMEWLGDEGYPLEFRTARAFQEADCSAKLGLHIKWYDDKLREVDVEADWTRAVQSARFPEKVYASLRISIECKYSRDKPWIVLATGQSALRKHEYIPRNHFLKDAIVDQSVVRSRRVIDCLPLPNAPADGFCVVQAFKSNRDVAYDSLCKVVEAAHLACAASDPMNNRVIQDAGIRMHRITVPCIVLAAPLFRATLAESGEAMQVDAVGFHRVIWRGSNYVPTSIVDIVTEEYLSKYADKVQVAGNRLESFVRDLEAGEV